MAQEIALLVLEAIAIYFLSINIIYGALMIFSWMKVRRFNQRDLLSKEIATPGVSFIVPVYNEESLIVETIQTYLSLPQTNREIIVINDGSHDQTMRLLQIMFQLHRDQKNPKLFRSISFPELKVIEAPHLGKAQALNFGVSMASNELICTMDADTIPDARGVETCLRAFGRDQSLIAVGGVIQVLHSQSVKNNIPQHEKPHGWLASFQRIEYLRAFVCERLGWSLLRSTVLISGAFCMIKKEAVQKVGGFSRKSITEDLDLILRLRSFYKDERNSFQILPVTTCYTQVPSTITHLSEQRIRWQRGLVQTLVQFPKLLFSPTHGLLGFLAMPYMWVVEVLSPILEGIAAIVVPYSLYMGWISTKAALFFFAIGIFFNVALTLMGTHLDNKYVTRGKNWKTFPSIFHTIAIHFGYKQLNSWWRFMGLMKSVKRGTWGGNPREEITIEMAA